MLQIYFKFDIFALLLIKQFYKMKKLMSIFGIMLFAFALTLTSCGNTACAEDCASECCAEAAVCANTGEACLDDHSWCAPAAKATCCCGDETCDGSCHDADGESHDHDGESHSHEGGNEEHTH